jgi:beta-glucosidase
MTVAVSAPVGGHAVRVEEVPEPQVSERAFRRTHTARYKPAYWFGHGLGYTSWEYGPVAAGAVGADGDVTVRVSLRNTGDRPGREVVQVYLSRPGSSVERPVRWLVGHATVDASPGEEATLEIAVPSRSFAHWDTAAAGWTVEAGTYELHVASSVSDLRTSTSVTLGVTRAPGASEEHRA